MRTHDVNDSCVNVHITQQVYTNVRTAHEAWKDLASGYDVAIRGGSVMGKNWPLVMMPLVPLERFGLWL